MTPVRVTAKDLKLADVVIPYWAMPGPTAWCTAVVTQITDDVIFLFRPYAKTEDFSYTGGVMCYTGVEVYQIMRNGTTEFMLLSRQELK